MPYKYAVIWLQSTHTGSFNRKTNRFRTEKYWAAKMFHSEKAAMKFRIGDFCDTEAKLYELKPDLVRFKTSHGYVSWNRLDTLRSSGRLHKLLKNKR